MTVVKVERRADGYNIRAKFSGQYLNGEPIRLISGSILFDVYTDTKDEMPLTVLSSPSLPQVGNLYGEEGTPISGVYFNEATPRLIGRSGALYRWEVTYNIGGSTSTRTSGVEEETTPEPDQISFSASIETEDYASAFDLDGLPNQNTLGEWFQDPIIFKSGVLNMTWRYKEYANPLWKSRDFFQAVNNAPLWGFSPGTVKVVDIPFTATRTSETEYDVEYKLQYRPQGWNDRKANAGRYFKVGNVFFLATNEDGSPTESPVLLTSTGARLASGAAPHFLTFRTTYPKDLTQLQLADPFTI